MSLMSRDTARFRSAAALPHFALDNSSFQQSYEGYAFETALCLVESQSPLHRPVLDAPVRAASTMIEGDKKRLLLERVRSLETLLAGVRGYLDAAQWRALLDAADHVSGELAAALAEHADVEGVRNDMGSPVSAL